MEISKEEVVEKGYEFVTVQTFCDSFNPDSISRENVFYLIKNDKVDYMRPGNERFIVMTDKTKSYRPMNYGKLVRNAR